MKFSLKHTKHTATPLIWVLFYVLIIPTQLSNYVLCIGADGHIAFEVSIDGQCTDTHAFNLEHAEVSHREITMEGDHCVPCIDFRIFPTLDTDLHLMPANDAPTHLFVQSALLPHQKRTSTISTFTSPQRTPPFINPTLKYLRTTTLLI